MHKIATAKKLLELATPKINKMLDEGISGKEFDEAMKTVELAHYLYEIEMMEEKMDMHDDEVPAGRRTRMQ